MRAARLHAVGDLRVADEPEPEAGPGMNLVRVTAVGICGSDLHWWDDAGIGDARLERPLVLGHENAGVIAGGMTKTNTLGVVASIPIPEVIRNIDSFTLGAQSVNPKVTTRVVWVNKWFDPPKESEGAVALIEPGSVPP